MEQLEFNFEHVCLISPGENVFITDGDENREILIDTFDKKTGDYNCHSVKKINNRIFYESFNEKQINDTVFKNFDDSENRRAENIMAGIINETYISSLWLKEHICKKKNFIAYDTDNIVHQKDVAIIVDKDNYFVYKKEYVEYVLLYKCCSLSEAEKLFEKFCNTKIMHYKKPEEEVCIDFNPKGVWVINSNNIYAAEYHFAADKIKEVSSNV